MLIFRSFIVLLQACAMYPFTDPYFAGVVAPYGTQAMVSMSDI